MSSLPAPPTEGTPSYGPLSGSEETGMRREGRVRGGYRCAVALKCSQMFYMKEHDQLPLSSIQSCKVSDEMSCF